VSPLGYLALFAIGFVAAVINVIGGGGSFLTLPLLIFLGLPPSVANGTNRIAVLAQNVSAVVGFHRYNVLPIRWSLIVSIPAMAGAAIGAWAALNVPDVAFRRILSIVMLAVALGTLLHRRIRKDGPSEPRSAWHPATFVGFFLTGIYGGFLQAGVGFLALAVTTMAGLDLVRGNAVKVFSVLLLTLLSLAMFAGTGHVSWSAGMVLAVGSILGGAAGVRLAVFKGQKWLEQVVSVTIVVFAILLWVTG
jgi:uncharacterized membrane protein YfcA